MTPGLSGPHVAELVGELGPLVAGRPVREVLPLPPRDVLLVLGPPGEEDPTGPVRRLRLSGGPAAARLHLQIGSVRHHRGPVGPFFLRAAALLEGRRVRALSQVEGDRVVRLETEGPGPVLVAELLGRHGNLVLLDERDRVLEVLVPARGKAGERPRLAPGAPYALPPGRGGPRPGPPSLAALLPDPPPREGLATLAPLSWRVESSLGAEADTARAEEQRRDLLRRLERRRRTAEKRLAGLEARARAGAKAARVRRDGELLKGALGRLRRGAREITLVDWFDEAAPERTIPLDPRLSPRANVERIFARYKKLVRATEKLPAEIEMARAAVEAVGALVARAGDRDEDPADLEAEAVAAGWLRPLPPTPAPRTPAPPRLPYLRFTGLHGGEIRVGRNARDNDRLSFRASRGNDLWLHTSEAPGSHVVLRLARGREPDPEDVLDAAHLAIHYSPLRGAAKAGVHVARVKDLRKPKNAPPGLVTLSGGKVRVIRVETERLARLLAAGRPGANRSDRDA